MKRITLLCAIVLMFAGAVAFGHAAASTARPNILFVIFDDGGWQHAGAYACDGVKTPNLDRVAREGVPKPAESPERKKRKAAQP